MDSYPTRSMGLVYLYLHGRWILKIVNVFDIPYYLDPVGMDSFLFCVWFRSMPWLLENWAAAMLKEIDLMHIWIIFIPTLGETWPHSRKNVGQYFLHGAFGDSFDEMIPRKLTSTAIPLKIDGWKSQNSCWNAPFSGDMFEKKSDRAL